MKSFFISLIAVVSFTAGVRAGSWTDWIEVKKASHSEILIVSYYYYDYKEDADDLVQYSGKFSVMMQGLKKYIVTFKSPDELKGVKVLFLDGKIWEYIPGNKLPAQVSEEHWGDKIAGLKFAPPYSFFHYPGTESLSGESGNLRNMGFWVQVYMVCRTIADTKPETYTFQLSETEESYIFEVINRLINVTFDNDPFEPVKLTQN